MPRIDSRFGAVSLLAFALTLASGLAFAQDTPDGTHAKQLEGVTVTAPSTSPPPPPALLPADLTLSVSYPMILAQAKYVTQNQAPSALAKKNPDPCDKDADPILPQTGTKVETLPVFALPGEMGLKYVLYYNTANPYFASNPSSASNSSAPGWQDNIQGYWLDTDCSSSTSNTGHCSQTIAYRPDGSRITFSGGPTATQHLELRDNGLPVTNPVMLLTQDATSGNYSLQDEDALTEVYSSSGTLLSITDASGIGWTYTYGTNGTITVTHTNGQSFTIGAGAITDPAGNVYTLTSISGGGGFTVSYPGSPATVIALKNSTYSNPTKPGYDFSRFTEEDYNGVPYAYTSYVTANNNYTGWANGTSLADGSRTFSIAYAPDAAGNVTATVTNPLGHVTVKTYDGTDGSGGAYDGQLSSVSNNAVADCGATEATRTYDSNGNLAKTVDNNGNVHTYTYAANGQLQTETEAYGTAQARTTDYVWDPNLQLNRLLSVTVEGWSKTVYTYNAQNRLASVAVTNLSGNGTANQTLTTTYGYTLYPNGMVQTMTVTHPSPNNSDVDTAQYDALGNLTSMTDGLGHTTTYGNYNGLGEVGTITGPNGDVTNYTYDARGRVVTKTTHPNGSAATWTYAYDGFGLLASVSAPDGEVTTWNRDAEMRVTTMTHNDKDGTSTETYGYDANNDVTSKTVSRNGTGTYSTSATYDALGRPYQINGNHGQQLTYSYDGNGNVLSVTDATGHVTSYQYDALDRVTQKAESGGASPPMPSAAPSLSAPSASSGSYTVSWSSVSGATTYLLQEQASGGSWTTLQNSSATSLALSGKPSATFNYRVQACDVTGCGPWSNVGSVIVTHITGYIDGVYIDGSGNANIRGWACSTGLAESVSADLYLGGPAGSGTFIGRYTANQSSEPAVASACDVSSGSYRYSIPLSTTIRSQYVGQTIYVHGISPVGLDNSLLNNSGSFTVPVNEPASAPTLSAPANNATGSYTVSWTGVATATSYNLKEQINGGSWTTVQSSGATSWGAAGQSDGTYAYQVQACNSSGCSAWSPTSTTTVLFPPGSPPSVSSPSTNSTGSYTVSWSTIANATSYTLQEQVNGGAWSTVQSSSATTWSATGQANGTYGYQVQSCNSGGCSGWSSVSTTTVLHPPGSAPTISVPASSTTGSYTVSWSGVSTATSYNLQEQVNGGSWTTVQSGASTSWSTSGRGDATYGYQVQACNSSGCGPWSSVASTSVLLPPSSAPSLSVPGSNGSGSYTVSWSGVATATSYNLQEQVNGGGWTTVQSGASTSWSTSGRGDATYGYHVQACNSSGCGPWSSVASTTVLLPPSSAPALSVPGTNGNGSYTVSWSGVSTASSYTLQEQVNSGGWTTVQANGATSWNASGKGSATYGYRVQACNSGGCGPWSGTSSITVTIPVPIAINGQNYSTSSSPGSTGGASAAIGFEITGGNTWEVFTSNQYVANTYVTSGTVPAGATTVQYTWTEVGLANGANVGGGTVTNGAGAPTALSGNPSSNYYISIGRNSSNTAGLTYQVTVTFYNAAGANISSSTCTMTATVSGAL